MNLQNRRPLFRFVGLAVLMAIASILTVSCSSSKPSSTATSAPTVVPTPTPVSYTRKFKDFTMTLLNAEVIKDYKGKPAIRIYFDFTSHSDENISAMFSTMTTAFQKGVQLDTAMIFDDNQYASNYQKNIKKGVTIRCAVAFLLTDGVSPVTLEALAFPSFDSSSKIVREYSIK